VRDARGGQGINPDPGNLSTFLDTDAHAFLNLDFGIRLSEGLWFSVDGRNLLDASGYSYLQPPVADGVQWPSSGSLMPGDAIPLRGRNVRLRLKWEF